MMANQLGEPDIDKYCDPYQMYPNLLQEMTNEWSILMNKSIQTA